ncbi:MAG: hypothetical protein ACRD3W_05765, partial [Terriglobales bacterium]
MSSSAQSRPVFRRPAKAAELPFRRADEGIRPDVGGSCLILSRCMPISPSYRLAYIDWMRGLACVLMFQ